MYVQYSVFTLQQANHNKIEKKTLSKLVFIYAGHLQGAQGGSKSGGVRVYMCVHCGQGWVGGEVRVCYSTPLNCAVFVTEDVQVFSPHSEH